MINLDDGIGVPTGRFDSPMARAAQQSAAEGTEFLLWVSKQATSLAKLKVFHSMAKQVNDQQ